MHDPETLQKLIDQLAAKRYHQQLFSEKAETLLDGGREWAIKRPDDYVAYPHLDISLYPVRQVCVYWQVLAPVDPNNPLDEYGNQRRELVKLGEAPGYFCTSLEVALDLCAALNFGRNLRANGRRAPGDAVLSSCSASEEGDW